MCPPAIPRPAARPCTCPLQWRPGSCSWTPSKLNPAHCTHVLYSFAFLDAAFNPLIVDDTSRNTLVPQAAALKQKKPGLKVLLAIGGWSMNEPTSSYCTRWSSAVATATARKALITNTMNWLDRNGFDGCAQLLVGWKSRWHRGRQWGMRVQSVRWHACHRYSMGAKQPHLLCAGWILTGSIPESPRAADKPPTGRGWRRCLRCVGITGCFRASTAAGSAVQPQRSRSTCQPRPPAADCC